MGRVGKIERELVLGFSKDDLMTEKLELVVSNCESSRKFFFTSSAKRVSNA